ncbi:uncharacterized protein LOC127136687 [Lathyrus oleraceus]|uniref:uncharacterized protein LOC127136687 n=1 Tax=Pisum sativum TaxID=3888 RepID=UPI0021D2F7BC|nr:uncharacterized protein LOC127136687 [Pisum sativum]
MNQEYLDLCKKEIESLLEKNLIRKSKSPWSCTTFYVNNVAERERGVPRLVINYKPLNKVLKWIRYPIPNKKYLLDRVNNALIFSKFDMNSGYLQIQINESDNSAKSIIEKDVKNLVAKQIFASWEKRMTQYRGRGRGYGHGGRGSNNMLSQPESNIPLIGDWTTVYKGRKMQQLLASLSKMEDIPSSSSNKSKSYKEVAVNNPPQEQLGYFENSVDVTGLNSKPLLPYIRGFKQKQDRNMYKKV